MNVGIVVEGVYLRCECEKIKNFRWDNKVSWMKAGWIGFWMWNMFLQAKVWFEFNRFMLRLDFKLDYFLFQDFDGNLHLDLGMHLVLDLDIDLDLYSKIV